jgi:hypothetical protein
MPVGQLHVLKITDFDVTGVVLGHLETDERPYGVASRMCRNLVTTNSSNHYGLGVLLATVVDSCVAEDGTLWNV